MAAPPPGDARGAGSGARGWPPGAGDERDRSPRADPAAPASSRPRPRPEGSREPRLPRDRRRSRAPRRPRSRRERPGRRRDPVRPSGTRRPLPRSRTERPGARRGPGPPSGSRAGRGRARRARRSAEAGPGSVPSRRWDRPDNPAGTPPQGTWEDQALMSPLSKPSRNGIVSNVAVTARAWLIVTSQVPVPVQAPDQPTR